MKSNSRSLPLVVNCRFLAQSTTGVQRFAEEICLELKHQLPDAIFVSPRSLIREEVAERLHVIRVGRLRSHAWEQIELPKFLVGAGSPLLLNLGNTGPIVYRNQVMTLHDIAYLRWPSSFSLSFRTAYGALIPILLRRARALITVSEFSKREICTHYRYPVDRAVVATNAVSGKFRTGAFAKGSSKYLLAVSSPNKHKNFVRVIEAYRSWESRAQYELKIVGVQDSAFASQRFDALPPGVSFLGRVGDEELAELYGGAVGFVFPSLYEGFGIPPLEAQACGCPVIASSAAAIPETLGDSALYFDPYSVASIRQAMDELVTETSVRSRLIEKGYENIERFSWPRSAAAIAELVRRLA